MENKQFIGTDEIVLNRMFCGDYLKEKLGHEVINMYQSDGGEYYLYLNQSGSFAKKHKNRIKRMVLVRPTSYKWCVEVIGLADGLEDIATDENVESKITYGGVTLKDLFVGNHQDEGDEESNEKDQAILVTFKAKNVYRLSTPTYIIFKGGSEDLEKTPKIKTIQLSCNQANSSQKQYFSAEEDGENYRELLNLFNEPGEPMGKVNSDTVSSRSYGLNFFEICGIDHSELAFSNAFAYFLEKYPCILSEFAQKERCGKIDVSKLTVIREKVNNIDIFIETPSHIIVIENKVLSDINGRHGNSEEGLSQLDKYYTFVEKEAKEKEQYKGKKRLYVLLTPDHNNVDIPRYDPERKYQKVSYSKVLNFLKEFVKWDREYSGSDFYLRELMAAMEKHSQTFYNELFDLTERRFYQVIRSKGKDIFRNEQ